MGLHGDWCTTRIILGMSKLYRHKVTGEYVFKVGQSRLIGTSTYMVSFEVYEALNDEWHEGPSSYVMESMAFDATYERVWPSFGVDIYAILHEYISKTQAAELSDRIEAELQVALVQRDVERDIEKKMSASDLVSCMTSGRPFRRKSCPHNDGEPGVWMEVVRRDAGMRVHGPLTQVVALAGHDHFIRHVDDHSAVAGFSADEILAEYEVMPEAAKDCADNPRHVPDNDMGS